jgi:Ca2+-binding RTX toxin-like protein
MRVYGAVGLKLTGNSAVNTLYGGVKADSLYGGAGADRLIGGAGRDLLYGGKDSAADLFIFNSRSESAVGTGRDLVYDFVSARDKIDLHLIDANANLAGNQTFGFGSSTARAYSAWMVKSAGQLVIRLDVTGDARADLEIGLVGLTTAQKTDFLL